MSSSTTYDPGNPTLDDWRQLSPSEAKSDACGEMIREMQVNKFRRWGFVVYRCTYSDDGLWDRYIRTIYETVKKTLGRLGRDILLAKYFELIVIDDREKLEGATKVEVREHFYKWVKEHASVEKGGNDFAPRNDRWIPMFHYCVYVDHAYLNTIKEREEFLKKYDEEQKILDKPDQPNKRRYVGPKVICALIDLNCDPEGHGRDGFPEIEGCTQEYPGWILTEVSRLGTLYSGLSHGNLWDKYDQLDYTRPPELY